VRKFLAAVSLVLFSSSCVPADNPEFEGLADTSYPLVDISGKIYCSSTKIGDNAFLTAAHCLENPMGGLIWGKNGAVSFRIVKVDKEADLALITAAIDGPDAPVLPYEPDRFARILAVGYPHGLALWITEGLWIGDVYDDDLKKNHSGASAPVAPGNSGGGVFIKYLNKWYLVAVVQMRATDSAHIGIVSKPSVLKAFLSGEEKN